MKGTLAVGPLPLSPANPLSLPPACQLACHADADAAVAAGPSIPLLPPALIAAGLLFVPKAASEREEMGEE